MLPTHVLSDPLTLALAIVAVVVLGLAKGGFFGLGALYELGCDAAAHGSPASNTMLERIGLS